MANLVIPNVDDELQARIAAQAAAHGLSVEDEARCVLRRAFFGALEFPKPKAKESLADIARRLFGPEHGFDLELPPRNAALDRPPPDFSGPEFDG